MISTYKYNLYCLNWLTLRKMEQTIDHLWQGSRLSLTGYVGTAVEQQPVEVSLFLAVFAFIAILMHGRLFRGWEYSIGMLFNSIRRREIFKNEDRKGCIRLSCIFSAVLYSASLSFGKVSPGSLWNILSVLLVLALFRELTYSAFAWFSDKKQEISIMRTASVSAFSLIFVSSLPVALFSIFNLEGIRWAVLLYLGAGLAFFFTFYLKTTIKILISSGFSLFFSILYLCTLEILPICVAVKAVTS